MRPHPLDRPVWSALRSRQSGLAPGNGRAARFLPDVSPFAAAADDGPESLRALADLVPAVGSIILLQSGESPLPPGTVATKSAMGVQMIARRIAPGGSTDGIARLTEADAPEMLALASLTEPGPFLARTHRLGDFVGVKVDGRLVAMAGERLKPDGFTEVSGVCTHPDFRGRGHARIFVACRRRADSGARRDAVPARLCHQHGRHRAL